MNMFKMVDLEKSFCGHFPVTGHDNALTVYLAKIFAVQRFKHLHGITKVVKKRSSFGVFINKDKSSESIATYPW